jgi:peptidoglycan hydrolase-like protein with peptidoglycan-binding domain
MPVLKRERGSTRGAAGLRTRIAALVAAAILVAAGVIVVLLHAPGPGAAPRGQARAAARQRDAGTTAAPGPLRVVSVTPGAGARAVNGAGPIRVGLSGVPVAGSPRPRLSPALAGTWSLDGDSWVFTPAAGFPEHTRVTVAYPAGHPRDGLGTWTASFRTGTYSTLRLQQLLAQLGYLPLSWTPGAGGMVMPGSAQAQLAAAYQPPAGRFSLISGYPAALAGFWRAGAANLIDTGAIMAFESGHGLPMDGVAGTSLWAALLRAAAAQQGNPDGYTYAIASKSLPETLTIWHDGRKVFSSEANTGIPVDPTADGTFPVYLRYRFQVMRGLNPDGSSYADPVQFVAYFRAGQAVHYFPRYSYGWPQSLGCVELPLDAAARAWPYLTYGSLVTVSP